MARWQSSGPIEFPAWVRTFVLADWAEPDEQERLMGDIPPEFHVWHARRRWNTAKNRYYRENPAAGEQALQELIDSVGARRQDIADRW